MTTSPGIWILDSPLLKRQPVRSQPRATAGRDCPHQLASAALLWLSNHDPECARPAGPVIGLGPVMCFSKGTIISFSATDTFSMNAPSLRKLGDVHITCHSQFMIYYA